jgi:hypothetical protein
MVSITPMSITWYYFNYYLCIIEPVCSSIYYYLPLVLMGVFYSSYAAVLWPCVPLVLEKKYVGTGFGVAFAI